ncbi:MAG: hypothetical protein JWN01_1306 [Patescibacteria group bacterium]|nr:hypothetical protein [Patescibacteria group bacterium]
MLLNILGALMAVSGLVSFSTSSLVKVSILGQIKSLKTIQAQKPWEANGVSLWYHRCATLSYAATAVYSGLQLNWVIGIPAAIGALLSSRVVRLLVKCRLEAAKIAAVPGVDPKPSETEFAPGTVTLLRPNEPYTPPPTKVSRPLWGLLGRMRDALPRTVADTCWWRLLRSMRDAQPIRERVLGPASVSYFGPLGWVKHPSVGAPEDLRLGSDLGSDKSPDDEHLPGDLNCRACVSLDLPPRQCQECGGVEHTVYLRMPDTSWDTRLASICDKCRKMLVVKKRGNRSERLSAS